MIGSLTGTITARLADRLLVDVQGVGYWVHTGSWQPEGPIICYLYHQVREDASDLYGFVNLDTLDLFEKLISVSGVGPKAGLAILSLGSSERVRAAIIQKESQFLSQAPGVGNKVAQKISLELEKKLGPSFGLVDMSASGHYEELLEALQGLGYQPRDVYPYLQELPLEISDFSAQIKWVLQQIGKK